jgi:hypothetical protein
VVLSRARRHRIGNPPYLPDSREKGFKNGPKIDCRADIRYIPILEQKISDITCKITGFSLDAYAG